MRRLLPIACIPVLACAASIKPELKAEVDKSLADHPGRGETISASSLGARAPLKVGEWALYETHDKDGHPGTMRNALVGKEGDAWWLETESVTYTGSAAQKVLLRGIDAARPDPASIQLLRAITRKDGKETEMPAMMLGMMNSMLRGAWDSMTVDLSQLPAEDVKVPGGTFAGARKYHGKVKIAGFEAESDNWFHSAAPLSGMVKSVASDGSSTIELLDWGSGATSSFRLP